MTDPTLDPTGATARGDVLGPFRVRASRAAVEAFRVAIGVRGAGIPFTFPICWLAEAPVRSALAEAFSVGDEIPLHEGQSFEYERPLDVETDYRMTVRAVRMTAPEKLIIEASVADDDIVRLRMEMTLRLIARPEGTA